MKTVKPPDNFVIISQPQYLKTKIINNIIKSLLSSLLSSNLKNNNCVQSMWIRIN